MSQKIIRLFPHGREIKTVSRRRLMESLVDNNIFLRSDCGRKGRGKIEALAARVTVVDLNLNDTWVPIDSFQYGS